jgi:FMN phosphatase YigB (HAD superfamily)
MQVLQISLFLLHYPFTSRVYPGALDVIRGLRTRGRTAILSDGDVVFQPRKVERSGLWEAVDGEVLVYIHKEQMLDDVEQRYPARRYVMVDDKIRILSAMKDVWGERLTTVFVRQGHYAADRSQVDSFPAADVTIDRIGDLLTNTLG